MKEIKRVGWISALAILGCALCVRAEEKGKDKPGPLRVGWLFSEYTATGPHWPDKPYGYADMVRMGKTLIAPEIELVPLLEPGWHLG